MTISTPAEDSGAAATLRVALTEAAAGRYAVALRFARQAAKSPGGFGEANYVVGNLLFNLGQRHAARVEWRRTTKVVPMSPSVIPVPEFAAAANAMLKRH